MEPLVAYVDIDDTLIRTTGGKRLPVESTVDCVRRLHSEGAALYCWSAGGAAYAREVAEEIGIANVFAAFLPKPEVLIDDMRLDEWWLLELRPDECGRDVGMQELLERLRGEA